MTSPLQTRIAKLAFPAVLVFSLACLSHAGQVNWGNTGFNLNSGMIQGNGSMLFSNVDGMGFDILLTTKGLNGDGMGTFGGNAATMGNSFWFQGMDMSSGNPPPPTASLVEFQFFQTGTNIPVAVTGVDFSFQDAEVNERFNNVGYFDQSGNLQLLTDTSSAFAGSNGGIDQTLGADVIQNDSSYAGGTQLGKALDVDLSSTPITGFEFSPFRAGDSNNAGSVEMSGLGNLQLQGVPEASSALYGLALAAAIACSRWRRSWRTATQS
jgi:hypothetical protein